MPRLQSGCAADEVLHAERGSGRSTPADDDFRARRHFAKCRFDETMRAMIALIQLRLVVLLQLECSRAGALATPRCMVVPEEWQRIEALGNT
jgi:hypothetical protein